MVDTLIKTASPVGEPYSQPKTSAGPAVQHSMAQTAVLHILPGVVVTAIFFLTVPIVRRLGLPEDAAKLLFAMPLGVIALQLGFLLYQGRRQSGKPTLEGVVLYREPMPIWQYLVFGLLLLAWNLLIYVPVAQLTGPFLDKTLFSWMPAWYSAEADYSAYPRLIVLAVGVASTLVYGAAGVVEELYFRGYLLPRISRFKAWAPVIQTALFSIYHLDMLGYAASVFVGSLGLSYVAYWKKNVYLGAVLHGTLNALFQVIAFLPILLQ